MTLRSHIYEIIEPCREKQGSLLSQLYDYLMLGAIVLGLLPLMFHGDALWMQVCDKIACTVFVIDYLLRWYVAPLRSPQQGKGAYLLYPFTLSAIFDLLSILPSFHAGNASLRLFRVPRLFKVLRIFRFLRYYQPFRIMTSVMRKESATLYTVLTFAIFYIFITAIIMFNAEEEVNPETGKLVFETFFDALYWAACTLTTVGYGDICPVSWVGRLISMISAILGVAIIALPSGIFTASYLEELREAKAKKKK